ncbi:MAG: hypothetical protein J5J00_00500 [Deltaproteobacteria bacterium]|nr:hypothetical protein [Deltaproteobacteria bacterium]
MTVSRKTVLLLGGGYTLSRVAAILDPSTFIITSRERLKLDSFANAGWTGAVADNSSLASLQAIADDYPDIEVVVDSVPPPRTETAEADSGVRNLLRAFSKSKLLRVIYLSTTGVFGVEDGSWVNEDTPALCRHAWGRARLQCEEAYSSSPYETIALRIPAIYGPGRGLGTALRTGSYRMIADRDRWSNRIQVDDLAAAIAAAIRVKPLPGKICVADDCPALTSEVVSYYCDTFSLTRPASMTYDQAAERGMYTLLSNQRVSNRLMKDSLGIALKYPDYKAGAGSEFAL